MKKGLLLGSLLVLLSGYLLIRSDFVLERTRAQATAQFARLLNQPVEIKEAALSFFPPSLIVTGVQSRGKVSFSADEVRATLSLLSAVTDSWVLRELVIRNPSLALRETAFQWESNDRSVIIRKIKIEEGTFTYTHNEKELTLPHLNAVIFPNTAMHRFDVTFSGKAGRLLATHKLPLDSLQGTFVADQKQIRIENVRIQSNKTDLALHGMLTFGDNSPSKQAASQGRRVDLDLTLNMRGPVEEYTPWLAHVGTNKESQRVGVLKNLSGEVLLKSRIRGTLSDPAITGRLELLLQKLAGINSASRLRLQPPQRNSFAADFFYRDQRLSFKKIKATLFSGDLSGSASFPLFSKEGKYHFSFDTHNLALDEAASFLIPEAKSSFYGKTLNGRFDLSGRGAHWTTSGAVELTRAQTATRQRDVSPMESLFSLIEKGQWKGTGTDQEIRFDQADMTFPHGTAQLAGRWNKKTGLSIRVQAESQEIQQMAKTLNFPVTGQLHLTGTVTGTPDQPFFSGHAQLAHFKIKERSLGTLQSDLFYLNQTILFQRGSWETTQKGIAQGSGIIRFEKELAYSTRPTITNVNPQEILPLFLKYKIPLTTTASGSLRIDGEYKEGTHRITVDGPLAVSKGALYGESFTKGSLHLTVTEKKVQFDNVRLEKSEITAQGHGEISYKGAYRLDATGSADALQASDRIHAGHPHLSGNMHFAVRGKGSFKQPYLEVTADIEKLHHRKTPLGSGTVYVSWKGKEVVVRSNFPNRFDFSGKLSTVKPRPFSFQTAFDRFPVHTLLENVSRLPTLHASGKAVGQGDFDRLEEMNLSSHLTWISAKKGDYQITNQGPLEVSAQKGVFSIQNGAFHGPNTDILLTGGFTLLKKWELLVKGEADIALLRFFVPSVQSGQGTVHLDLRVTDQWRTPKMYGILSLLGGTVYLADAAAPIKITSLSLLFNQRHLLIESAEGTLGGGRFSGVGKALFTGWNVSQFGFTFDLTGMPITYAASQTAVVDGTLLFRGDTREQSLEGTLHLRRASYEKRVDLQQVLRDWEARTERLPVEIPVLGSTRLNIHLYGKENIVVHNNLANVDLEVDLQMKGSLDHPLLFGQIQVARGTFRFRTNNTFKITSGTVQFLDPQKINPVFDIQGESRIRNYGVALSLQGTLSRFALALSSSPSLPRADILSLLAVGKTTEEIAAAGDEAKTFVVSDLVAGFLTDPVEQFTGFSRITVGASSGAKGTKSSKNTRITFEDQLLKDKLLVVYSKALDPAEEDSFLFFYELGKNLAVAGGRDEDGQMGGDLRFRFQYR